MIVTMLRISGDKIPDRDSQGTLTSCFSLSRLRPHELQRALLKTASSKR